MTLWVKKIYIVAFMLSIGLFYIWTSFSRPSVLVIHAFNPNNQITDKVSRGIDSVFSKRTYYHVYEHFMDLKNNNIKDVKIDAPRKAFQVIDSINPEFLLLVGDIPQKLIGEKYLDHPYIKIVYANIDQYPKDYGYNTVSNVTGIRSLLPISIFNDLFNAQISNGAYKSPINIYIIGDDSDEALERFRQLKSYSDWKNVSIKPVITCKTETDWTNAFESVSDPNGIIVLTSFQRVQKADEESDFTPTEDLITKAMKTATVPVVGTSSIVVSQGGHFAITASVYEQGVVAAEIVEDLIENDIYINEIPGKVSQDFMVYMRRHPSKVQQKLFIPPIYAAFAKAMNHYYK